KDSSCLPDQPQQYAREMAGKTRVIVNHWQKFRFFAMSLVFSVDRLDTKTHSARRGPHGESACYIPGMVYLPGHTPENAPESCQAAPPHPGSLRSNCHGDEWPRAARS